MKQKHIFSHIVNECARDAMSLVKRMKNEKHGLRICLIFHFQQQQKPIKSLKKKIKQIKSEIGS